MLKKKDTFFSIHIHFVYVGSNFASEGKGLFFFVVGFQTETKLGLVVIKAST